MSRSVTHRPQSIELRGVGEFFYDVAGIVHSLKAFMLYGLLGLKVLQELFYGLGWICFSFVLFYA